MKNIKGEAIRHYTRMIRYAESKYPSSKVNIYTMEDELGEDCFGKFCSYCLNSDRFNKRGFACKGCSLIGEYGCCNGAWNEMSEFKTYGDFAYHAKRVRRYIIMHGGVTR